MNLKWADRKDLLIKRKQIVFTELKNSFSLKVQFLVNNCNRVSHKKDEKLKFEIVHAIKEGSKSFITTGYNI